MKLSILNICIIFFSIIVFSNAQITGKIYFENGNIKEFYDFKGISASYPNGPMATLIQGHEKEFLLYVDGSERYIPLNSFKYFLVKSFTPREWESGRWCLSNVDVEVVMKNGYTKNLLFYGFGWVFVKIKDEFSGELKEVQFNTCDTASGKINIRKIEID